MRKTEITRQTKETDIRLTLDLDGSGCVQIETGIGFFDHMLTAFAMHGGFDVALTVKGDTNVDCHHTIEDTGIVLGQAFGALLKDKSGVARYGSFYVPMDEALGFCAVDISGRPFLVFDASFRYQRMGGMETAMVGEFFRALAFHSGITLHLKALYGENDHHKAEALFKAAGHALRLAVLPRAGGVLSTKGVLV